MIAKSPWFIYPKPNPQSHLRLFCFPYAGAGASVYHTWSTRLPPNIEVCSVQLPGRESRLREPRFTSLLPLIHSLIPALLPALDTPFAFFGHSLGALVCFELVRHLRRLNYPRPLHLFVSGRGAPQIPDSVPPIHQLPDADFITELRQYNGTPEAVLQNPELMEWLVPILRSDLAINETYVYTHEVPLECPISAFGGLQDRKVSRDDIAAWQEQTCDTFILRMFPGNHFFLKSSQEALLQDISESLS